MLREVSEHKERHESCVKELSYEHPVSDVGHLLRLSVVSNPLNIADSDGLQNRVDNNEHNRNG